MEGQKVRFYRATKWLTKKQFKEQETTQNYSLTRLNENIMKIVFFFFLCSYWWKVILNVFFQLINLGIVGEQQSVCILAVGF